MIIKVRDSFVKHYPPFLKNSKDITYLYDEIEDGDVVLYTNRHFNENHDNVKMKIAVLMETREQELEYYNYIENNYNKFDLVFTHDKYLLDLGIKNIKLINCLTPTWLNDNYINLHPKTKLCSMISSSKNNLSGHKFRLKTMNYINDNFKNIDLYGNNFKHLAFSKSANTQCLSNGKINALKDYMFSVIIENSYYDYNFTEKIIDCFLSGTIPIYWGCPSIHKFFNIKGILIFNTIDELDNILHNLSNNLYTNMYEYIEENYKIAHNYKFFNLNDSEILNYYNKKFYYQEINEWFSSKGDLTYSLNHNLSENSIVIDVGAYKGLWAEQLYNKFKCNIYLIEPINEFYNILEQKFSNNSKISYKNIGLSNKNSIINIHKNSINNDSTKLINSNNSNKNSKNCFSIELMTLDRFLLLYNLKTVDLIQVNIEGAEYDLLDHWIETDIVNSINTIQIQFHNFDEIKNHIIKREIIRNKLKNRGFKLKYCFNWVWECYTK